MQHSVYLSLGSNIKPEINIPKALRKLEEKLTLAEVSAAWCTRAIGTKGPDFVNLAVHIFTIFEESILKEEILCGIERQMGRIRTEDKFAPRPIDIDIILFDNQLLDENLASMSYLLLPFSELLPDFTPPTSVSTLKELSQNPDVLISAKRLQDFPQQDCLGKAF